jgi:hypothetical protein
MGYTHYWTVRDLDRLEQALPQVAADLGALRPQLPHLAGPMGEGEAKVGPQGLYFNGASPEDCESFILDARRSNYVPTADGLFGFCKTRRLPYDLAVKAALTLARWHAGKAVEVRSDGTVAEWADACRLVERELGYPVDPFFVLGETPKEA